eukprot:CAMPEP_0194048430 /NCGR_PEP_ID=MMETSP0009_2-20130614/27263_1 /TAXON_ID=210454 /ORGANISM="Grammatophora oceanica, Strain CCMP 410" /LENGTH=402 /DNA_ID=CAMNT_0038694287 /DNA_START=17 /DNA_END=1225 /DNA_ORIENTATION=+
MTTSTTISTPPPPFDDPSLTNPLECPPLKWGIIGCGRVSHDFTQATKHLPSASVVACAARRLESAQTFADKHKIPKAYGSYDELLQDDSVECVYVGNVHSFRRSIGEKCLKANKHVLLEKPFACSTEDAEYLIGLAKERDLFLMEGMWTRFFPAVEQARRLVFGPDAVLGEVVHVCSDFNFNASDSEEYPSSFVYTHNLGGGSSYLVAPYPLAAASLFYKGVMPSQVSVVGQVDEATGVDLQAAAVLNFAPTSDVAPVMDADNKNENTPKLPGAGTACLSFGMLGESNEETTVIGTKGRLVIRSPGHCPTKLSVTLKAEGRGNAAGSIEYEFVLPEDTDEITKSGGFVYPNSAGFAYEAAAVARCIGSDRKETPQYTLQETLVNARLVDAIRDQLGVKPIAN